MSVLTEPRHAERLEVEHYPRDLQNRYRICRLPHGSSEPQTVCTTATPQGVGLALITLHEEGEFAEATPGVLDTHGRDDVAGTWIVNPFGRPQR